MKISENSLSYRLWAFTFSFSGNPPSLTTPWRFKLRLALMPLVLIIMVACGMVIWIVWTIVSNVFTILSGYGVCITWTDEDGPLKAHPRRFKDVSIGKGFEVPVWGIVVTLWTCLALFALWYWQLSMLFTIASYAVGIIAVFLILAFIVSLVDVMETDDFPRLLRTAHEALQNGDQSGDEVLGFYSEDESGDEIG